MPGPKTKAEWLQKLQDHGEHVPKSWTVSQMMARWAEVKENQTVSEVNTLATQLKKLNKAAQRKPTLVEYVRDLGLEVNPNQTIAQITSMATKWVTEQHEPSGEDLVGFGMHGDKSYQDILDHQKSYATWVIQTDMEDQEASWRLKRLARWLRQQKHMSKIGKDVKPNMPKENMSSAGSSFSFTMVDQSSQEQLLVVEQMKATMKATLAQKMEEVDRTAAELRQEKTEIDANALQHKTRREM